MDVHGTYKSPILRVPSQATLALALEAVCQSKRRYAASLVCTHATRYTLAGWLAGSAVSSGLPLHPGPAPSPCMQQSAAPACTPEPCWSRARFLPYSPTARWPSSSPAYWSSSSSSPNSPNNKRPCLELGLPPLLASTLPALGSSPMAGRPPATALVPGSDRDARRNVLGGGVPPGSAPLPALASPQPDRELLPLGGVAGGAGVLATAMPLLVLVALSGPAARRDEEERVRPPPPAASAPPLPLLLPLPIPAPLPDPDSVLAMLRGEALWPCAGAGGGMGRPAGRGRPPPGLPGGAIPAAAAAAAARRWRCSSSAARRCREGGREGQGQPVRQGQGGGGAHTRTRGGGWKASDGETVLDVVQMLHAAGTRGPKLYGCSRAGMAGPKMAVSTTQSDHSGVGRWRPVVVPAPRRATSRRACHSQGVHVPFFCCCSAAAATSGVAPPTHTHPPAPPRSKQRAVLPPRCARAQGGVCGRAAGWAPAPRPAARRLPAAGHACKHACVICTRTRKSLRVCTTGKTEQGTRTTAK